jgi:hypothetical protein
MTVRYHTRRGHQIPDYQCVGESIQTGARRCLTVSGGGVDHAIGQLLLATVTPLALADLPALWTNPATPQRERKRMTRLLIDASPSPRPTTSTCTYVFRGGRTTTVIVGCWVRGGAELLS